MIQRMAALLVIGVLAGCATAISPAPVVTGDAASSDPWALEPYQPQSPSVTPTPAPAIPAIMPQAMAPPKKAGPGEVVVQSGDTLFAISRRHNTSLRSLIDANGLKPPYGVMAGQLLRIPVNTAHRVARGETLGGIAKRYGVASSELVRLNNIKRPYHVLIGQTLVLPGAKPPAASKAQSVVATASARPSRPAPAAPPMSYDYAEDSTSSPLIEVAPKKPPALVKLTKMPPRAGKQFAWPTKGKILTGYGPRANGLHNDGINIAAAPNSPVMAAENGIVSYAGSDLEGYGNLLLIKHAGGWITAYAHNSELLVSRGDSIRRGQTIALAGRTGGVKRDQVHFEIRNGAKPVNPMRLLAGG